VKQPASLKSQVFWLLVAKTAGFVLSLLLPLLLVRVLDQFRYGQYRQIFVLVNTAMSLLPLGVSFSAFYFFPREKERHRQIVLNILLFYAFVSGLAFLLLSLYPPSIVWFLGEPALIPYARITGVVVFFLVFSSMIEVMATAYQEVAASTIFIVGANLSKTVLLVAAVMISPTIEAILAAAVAQGVMQTGVLLWYLGSRFPKFWLDFDAAFFGEQLRYALPLGVSGVLITLQRELHNFFVSNQFGTAAYAVYAVGCFQIPLISLLRESITAVLIPKTSEYQQQGRIDEIIALTAKSMRKIALAYWPVFAFLMVSAEEFIRLLFTARYLDSVPIFRLNLLLLPTIIPVTDPIFRAFAQYRYYIVRVRAVLLAILVALLFAISTRFGMAGAIGAVLAVTAVERTLICWKSARILEMKPADWRQFSGTLTTGISAAAAAAPALLVRHFVVAHYPPLVTLLLCGAVYVAAYAGVLVAFGFIEADEKAMITGLAAKLRARLARA
jgi:O-antigen/teichoic acid export membrane protein